MSLKRCLGRACYDTDTLAGMEKRRWGSFSFRLGLQRLFSQENAVALLKMIIVSCKMKWQVAGRLWDGTGEMRIVFLQLMVITARRAGIDPRVSWHLLTDFRGSWIRPQKVRRKLSSLHCGYSWFTLMCRRSA